MKPDCAVVIDQLRATQTAGERIVRALSLLWYAI
jgi:phosphosulfolactate phosphohydrolase-like enzyme